MGTVIDLASRRNRQTELNATAWHEAHGAQAELDAIEWHEANGYRHAGANTDTGVDVWVRTDGDRASVHVLFDGYHLAHNYLMPADKVQRTVEAHIRAQQATR